MYIIIKLQDDQQYGEVYFIPIDLALKCIGYSNMRSCVCILRKVLLYIKIYYHAR